MVICGFLYSGFFVLLHAMTADVVDEIRLTQRHEQSGMLYGLMNLAPKVAAAVAVWMAFAVLAHFQYSPAPGATNSALAIAGLHATYLLGPFGFVAAAGLMMIGYRLGPVESAKIREQLAAREALARREAAPLVES